MHILFDECFPRALRSELSGHEVRTVAELGWSGVKNGELLRLAALQFDVLLTVDRKLEYQQNFDALDIAVIVVIVLSNDIAVIRPLIAKVRSKLVTAERGVVTRVFA